MRPSTTAPIGFATNPAPYTASPARIAIDGSPLGKNSGAM
jgi:hypothetical protein